MEDMGKFIENTGNDVKRMTTQLSEVQTRHIYMCGFIGVEKNDEMYEKSDEFFKIFQLLFKQVE